MKLKKIIAGLMAFILIGAILLFANALMGNPISKTIVNRSARNYVKENYSELNLELDKAQFNFKDARYHVHARSKTSIDTHFSMSFTGRGKLVYDDYEDRVLGKFNTWERVNTAYRDLVDTVLEHDFPYESEIDYGEILDKHKGLHEFEVDKEYDIKEMGREKGNVVLYITSDILDAETLTKALLEIKGLFDQRQVPFYSINLVIRTPRSENNIGRESIEVQGFLYRDIYEEDLQERVNENIYKTKKYYEEMDREKEAEIINNI